MSCNLFEEALAAVLYNLYQSKDYRTFEMVLSELPKLEMDYICGTLNPVLNQIYQQSPHTAQMFVLKCWPYTNYQEDRDRTELYHQMMIRASLNQEFQDWILDHL